jgi:hypothetical protein
LDEIAASDWKVNVIHRSGKLGIGAHFGGIAGLTNVVIGRLVTMIMIYPPPSDIAKLLEVAIVVM